MRYHALFHVQGGTKSLIIAFADKRLLLVAAQEGGCKLLSEWASMAQNMATATLAATLRSRLTGHRRGLSLRRSTLTSSSQHIPVTARPSSAPSSFVVQTNSDGHTPHTSAKSVRIPKALAARLALLQRVIPEGAVHELYSSEQAVNLADAVLRHSTAV